ncbi:MAG: PSD1 and planctomycete cytochrome C domain-containing protein [Verrucomicrobiota bacterium]
MWVLLALPAGAAEPLAFNRDIRPVLSKTCFTCHGPDAAAVKAELRLDLRERALKGGVSGRPAIVPGDPAASEVVRHLTSKDPEQVMPPPAAHLNFTAEEAATLTQWIKEGASYEGHWAFQAPVKAALPAGTAATANPIDPFIAARLKTARLDFAPEADGRTLIRRLSLDLTGLPPSPEEIHAYLEDRSPQAYETLVDRLLASPRLGEHFASSWLDAARYADTNGYSIDGGRQQWLWRDWVIKSFNDNQPYDQFLTEQLAGDLLPNASEQQLVATGFGRNHAITHEGGTLAEENLVNYVADRVKTTSETFLGLTLACAQCHDHKYDPFTQRDYYRFFAFFNTLGDAGHGGDGGVNAVPSIQAGSCLATPAEAASVRHELESLREALAAPIPDAQAKWESAQRADLAQRGHELVLTPLEVITATCPNGDPERIKVLPDHSVTIGGGDFAAYNVLTRLPAAGAPIRGIRIVFSPTPQANGMLGYGGAAELKGNFHLGSLTASVSSYPAGNVDLNAILPIVRLSASGTQAGFDARNVLNTDPLVGWAPPTGSTTPQHLTATFAAPLQAGASPYLTVELLFNYGQNTSPASFRIFAFSGCDDGSPHPAAVTEMLTADPASRSAEQAVGLRAYFHQVAAEKAWLRSQIANLEERLAMLTQKHPVLVMNTAASPRVTHILNRGLYSSPLEAVAPGTPGVLPPLSNDPAFDPATGSFRERPANRLDLARWLTRPDHPLTSRVAVNRLWEHFFGRGLAASSADLGSQGQWPSHPELLDWLAVDFRESGWDRKRLMRLIVTSRTYRQTSDTRAELLARDPHNEWLARGPRFRLTAEQIRDQALAVSGLLAERLGGPSVRPYQPGDLWRQVSHYGSSPATSQTFVQDHGEKLYRRSLYTYWKRTLPPPGLSVFDAPNREICSIGRLPTNTPLQALVTLNDPQFVEAARALGLGLLQSACGGDRERISAGFERVTARLPVAAELATLVAQLARERLAYQAQPGAARDLLAIGEMAQSTAFPLAEQAAWTQLAATLLNLSEVFTRR